jgi:hypothetical protein
MTIEITRHTNSDSEGRPVKQLLGVPRYRRGHLYGLARQPRRDHGASAIRADLGAGEGRMDRQRLTLTFAVFLLTGAALVIALAGDGCSWSA